MATWMARSCISVVTRRGLFLAAAALPLAPAPAPAHASAADADADAVAVEGDAVNGDAAANAADAGGPSAKSSSFSGASPLECAKDPACVEVGRR